MGTFRTIGLAIRSAIGVNPWRHSRMYGAKGSFSPWFASTVRLWCFGAVAALITLLISLPTDSLGWMWRSVAVVAFVVVAGALWSRPTWSREVVPAGSLGPGQIFWGVHDPDVSTPVQGNGIARTIAETFGPDDRRSRWIAFVDGSAISVPEGADCEILVPYDAFGVRPLDFVAPPPECRLRSEDLDFLGQLWNEKAARLGSRITLQMLQERYGDAAPTADDLRRLSETGLIDRRARLTPTTYLLSTSGDVHVAAAIERAAASAPDLGAVDDVGSVQLHLHDITGDVQLALGSNGVVQQRDNGIASVSSLDPEVRALLSQVVEAARVLESNSQADRLEIARLVDGLSAQLGERAPDEALVRSLTARLLTVGGNVLVGAVGSAVWSAVSAWLRLAP